MGSQIVREVSRQLRPRKVVVASLFREEVEELLHEVRQEFPEIAFVGEWGNVFVREAFRELSREQLLSNPAYHETLAVRRSLWGLRRSL